MKTCYFILLVIVFFMSFCTSSNRNNIDKSNNDFKIYTVIYGPYASEKIHISYDDTLLYNGNFIPSEDNGGIMFISGIKKSALSHIRLNLASIDTTFSVSTMSIDSILVGVTYQGVPFIFDSNEKNAWMFE